VTYQLAIRRYNPDQPRAPEGAKNGGQWISAGGMETIGSMGEGQAPGPIPPGEGVYIDDLLPRDSAPAEEAHKELSPRTFAYMETLTRDDHEYVIEEYQKDYYLVVNAVHRGTIEDKLNKRKVDDPEYKKNVITGALTVSRRLDDIIADYGVSDKDYTVYRAFRNEQLVNNHDKLVGRVFREPGFLSTTLNPRVATKFYDMKQHMTGGTTNAVVLRMRKPAGTQGLYLNANPRSPTAWEHEFLMPRNTSFVVTGVTRLRTGGIVIDADIQGQRP
jgi:hypothetical protein